MKSDFEIFTQINFISNEKLNLLDVGCGCCDFLFNIYSFLDKSFNRIDAIDSGKDFDRVEGLESGNDLFKQYNSNCSISNKKDLKPGIMYYHECDVNDFLKSNKLNKLSYDIILMRNFLHCLKDKNEATTVIQNCIPKLSKNGFIYIEIATSNFADEKNESEYGPKWGCSLDEIKEWSEPLNLISSSVIDGKWNRLLLKIA